MLSNPFTKWLWDNRRSLVGWSLAMAFVGGGYAAFWPTIDTPEMRSALDAYPQAVLEALNYDEITSAAGYLNATIYGLLGAVLLIVFAVGAGSRLIAGTEEDGTLDLILSHPLSRTSLGLQRFGALVAGVVVIDVALWLAMLALIGPADLDGISVGQFAAMHLHLAAFGVLFGALAYAVGAATGRRSWAMAGATGVAVLGFLANGVISQVEGWERLRSYSPFDWLIGGKPLVNGVQAGDVMLMIGLSIVLVGIGTVFFGRRDVAV